MLNSFYTDSIMSGIRWTVVKTLDFMSPILVDFRGSEYRPSTTTVTDLGIDPDKRSFECTLKRHTRAVGVSYHRPKVPDFMSHSRSVITILQKIGPKHWCILVKMT